MQYEHEYDPMAESIKTTKELTLIVLDVLKKHSDINNTLTQSGIQKLIIEHHGKKYGVKAIRDSLNHLVALGFDVDWKNEGKRNAADGDYETVRYDWYYVHEFDPTELHFLIDGLFFSKYIPKNQCKHIIEKLVNQSSKYFKHGHKMPDSRPNANHRLLNAIGAVNEAIERRLQISFQFNAYDVKDKKLKPVPDRNGSLIRTVSPYRIAIKNERFYMICAFDKGDYFYHFRLDYMDNLKVLGEEREKGKKTVNAVHARKVSEILGVGRELDLENYLKARVYMHGGKPVQVKFRAYTSANPYIVGHIIDWLGEDVEFTDVSEESVTVSINTNPKAMLYWALQYGLAVEILQPDSLRNEVRDALQQILARYG